MYYIYCTYILYYIILYYIYKKNYALLKIIVWNREKRTVTHRHLNSSLKFSKIPREREGRKKWSQSLESNSGPENGGRSGQGGRPHWGMTLGQLKS